MNINQRTGQYECLYCRKKFHNKAVSENHLASHFGGIPRQQSDDDDTRQSVQPPEPIKSEPSDNGYQDTMSNRKKQQSIKSEAEKRESSRGRTEHKRKRKRKQSRPEHIVNSEPERSGSKHKLTPPSNSETYRPRIVIKIKIPPQPYKPSDDEDYASDENDVRDEHIAKKLKGKLTPHTFACDQCPMEFIIASNIKKHKETHHAPDEDDVLNEHIAKKKRRKRIPHTFACDQCPRKFRLPSSLAEHEKTHTKLNHACNYCAERFYDREKRRKHERHVHRDIVMQFKCTFCTKAFQYPNFLASHIRIHTGEKPFKCEVCKKCFTERGTLVAHRRVHFNETPYHCSLCDRQFKHNSSLRAHTFAHYKVRKFKCDPCTKYYHTKKTLRNHRMLFHPEQFEHDKKFTAELKRLKEVGGPLLCPECNSPFASKRTVRVHTMRTHNFNYDEFMRNKSKGDLAPIITLAKQFGVDFSNTISVEANLEQNSGREMSLPEALQSNHAEPADPGGSTPNLAIEASLEMIGAPKHQSLLDKEDKPKRASKKTKKKTDASRMAGTEDFEQKDKTKKAATKTGKAKSKYSTAVKIEKNNTKGETKTGKAKSKRLTTKVKVEKIKANGDTKTEKPKSKKLVAIKTENSDAMEDTKTGKAKSKRLTTTKRTHVRRNSSHKAQSLALLDEILPNDDGQDSCSDAEPSQDDVILFDEAQIRVCVEEVILAIQPTDETIAH